ncbi:hypothetical protein TSAR_014386 [Trichomalopsis sarcophagae]|uniref:Uncharacterized protein n=1 Tax=Trichomalopsis sarcophagae TaxID=543379 RepID=A0A232EEB1_9HYME|nr:hypothetical protein TSAR_014386 [Trichomalopsis sarcophagae]
MVLNGILIVLVHNHTSPITFGAQPYIPDHVNSIQRNYKKLRWNHIRLQSSFSNACGKYCIMFLYYMINGMGMQRFLKNFSSDLRKNDQLAEEFAAKLWLDKRDITIARLRTSTNATKYRCHQILPMVFGLNNSYGKIVNIGLQNTSVASKKVRPCRFSLDPLYSTSDSIGHPLVVRLFFIGLASH